MIALFATCSLGGGALADVIELSDPRGDDKGPGTYAYPTDPVYRAGSFDLTGVKIEEDGDDITVDVEVSAKIEDPWKSKEWGGNGFSLQFAQLYIDCDHAAGKGHLDALPGMNVRFAPESAWDKVVLISPQGKTRLSSEVGAKAASVKGDVIVPRVTRARGRTLTAIFSKSDLGRSIKGCGVQVLLQSNEGYPDKADLLTRKVNEFAGQHRFGGGNDWECDPHVIDMLVAPAKGGDDEAAGQKAALSYTCDPRGDLSKSTLATIPMIYP
jgi:carbohydrate-binding DOMON domain-containing protein